MDSVVGSFRKVCALCACAAALASADTAAAQTQQGQARAVQASVVQLLGINTVAVSDTGMVSGADDAREASQGAYTGSLVSADTLHASTITWANQVASEASVADLVVNVAGATIAADFVMARAQSVAGAPGANDTEIDGLSINGVPVTVTGLPNQAVSIPGGWVVINEQRTSPGSAAVNALHVVISGVADVVVASATARVQ
jgi:hypothetical protein